MTACSVLLQPKLWPVLCLSPLCRVSHTTGFLLWLTTHQATETVLHRHVALDGSLSLDKAASSKELDNYTIAVVQLVRFEVEVCRVAVASWTAQFPGGSWRHQWNPWTCLCARPYGFWKELIVVEKHLAGARVLRCRVGFHTLHLAFGWSGKATFRTMTIEFSHHVFSAYLGDAGSPVKISCSEGRFRYRDPWSRPFSLCRLHSSQVGLVFQAVVHSPLSEPSVLWRLQHSSTLSVRVHDAACLLRMHVLRLGTYSNHWASICFTNVPPKLGSHRHDSLFGRNYSLTLLLVLLLFLIQDLAVKKPICISVSQLKSLCTCRSWLPVAFSTCCLLNSPSKWSSELRLKCRILVDWVLWCRLLGWKVKLCLHLQGAHQSLGFQ